MITLFIFIVIYLLSIFCIVSYKKDISIANFTWGGGCALVAFYGLFSNMSLHKKQIFAAIITILWCIRMVVHLYVRYTGKDARFISWNKKNKIYALIRSFLYILCIQFPLLIVMSIPIFFMMNHENFVSFTIFEYLILDLWIFALIYEAIADYQLYIFLSNPREKNEIMDTGLWKYSRHPNYFGEILFWWMTALFVFVSVKSVIVFLAPLTITILLVYISGIPLIEKAMKNNENYQKYKNRTSKIIPWFVDY